MMSRSCVLAVSAEESGEEVVADVIYASFQRNDLANAGNIAADGGCCKWLAPTLTGYCREIEAEVRKDASVGSRQRTRELLGQSTESTEFTEPILRCSNSRR